MRDTTILRVDSGVILYCKDIPSYLYFITLFLLDRLIHPRHYSYPIYFACWFMAQKAPSGEVIVSNCRSVLPLLAKSLIWCTSYLLVGHILLHILWGFDFSVFVDFPSKKAGGDISSVGRISNLFQSINISSETCGRVASPVTEDFTELRGSQSPALLQYAHMAHCKFCGLIPDQLMPKC